MQKYDKLFHIGKSTVNATKKVCSCSVSEHFHEFYELEVVLDGSGEYSINGKVFNIERGALFFMTPFDFHSVKTTGFSLYNVMFSSSICSPEILAKLSSVKAVKVSESDLLFLSSVLNELTLATNESYVSSLLAVILFKISSLDNFAESAPLTEAIAYVLNNFRSELTLKQVSKVTGYTESYFSTLFKKETGTTFKNYLDGLRLEYAENLIKHTNYTVYEICKLSGFLDYSNFVRRIKKKYGITALELRKRYQTTI